MTYLFLLNRSKYSISKSYVWTPIILENDKIVRIVQFIHKLVTDFVTRYKFTNFGMNYNDGFILYKDDRDSDFLLKYDSHFK